MTEPRAVLVGECNPRSSHPSHALYPYPRGCAGHRLVLALGWSVREYMATFTRANLCGSKWDTRRARLAASQLGASALAEGLDVVMLGAKVAAAFGAGDLPLWEAGSRGSARLVRVPHPSGRCREWNDPAARFLVRALLEPYRTTLPTLEAKKNLGFPPEPA